MVLLAGSAIAQRSCPLEKFCNIGANCCNDSRQCVETCPTARDRFQQGNWSTGNCERSKPGYIHYNYNVIKGHLQTDFGTLNVIMT